MPRKHVRSKSARPKRRPNLIWLWIALGLVILIVGAVLVFQSKTSPASEITVAQAYAKYQQGAFFLDVRTQDEWTQERLANSHLIPLDDLSGRLGEMPRDQDIVVICRSGTRSKLGLTILQQAGFTRASCMTGGLNAWKAAGYPVVSGTP